MLEIKQTTVARQFAVSVALAACDVVAISLLPDSMTRHLLYAGTIIVLIPFVFASGFIVKVLAGAACSAIYAHYTRHKRHPIQDWARSRIGGVRFALSDNSMRGPHILLRLWIVTLPFALIGIYFLVTI